MKKNGPVPNLSLCVLNILGTIIFSRLQCVPDTGASITVFPLLLFNGRKLPGLKKSNTVLTCANHSRLQVFGEVELVLERKSVRVKTRVIISEHVTKPLICFSDLVKLGIVPQSFPDVNAVMSLSGNTYHDGIRNLVTTYSDVFDTQDSTPMKYPPLRLELKDNAIPYHVYTARPFPKHLEKESLEELIQLEKDDLIAKQLKPSSWCAASFTLPKRNGGVRLVVDFSKLSQWVKRPVHPFPCVKDILQSLPPTAKYFLVLDATKGYYQIKLHPDSYELTCFLTPIGRFYWKRAPFGLNASGDIFNQASDACLEGLPNCKKIVDDILCFAATLKELYQVFLLVFCLLEKDS